MGKPSIACNIIMRDVADTILACISSTNAVFDQYVFCDTGSKDGSRDIVTKWCEDNKVNYKIVDYKGYKFNKDDKRERKNWGDIAQYEWDFGDARQIALVNTDTDWMFWMDADDVMVNPEGVKALMEDAEMANIIMINLPYHYAQDAQGNDVIYQYRERLLKVRFDGEVKAKWNDPVHEYCLIPQEYFINPPAIRQEVRLVHKRTMEHVIETNRRNNRILYYKLEQERLNGKLDVRTLSVLAFDHYEHKEWEECIRYYKELFEELKKLNDPNLDRQYTNHIFSYAKACIAYRDFETALSLIEKTIMMDGNNPESYILKAEIYIQLNNVELAERYIELARSRGIQESMTPSSPLELKLKPLYMLMDLESRKGNLDKAIGYVNEALSIVPQDGSLVKQRRNLINSIPIKKAYEAIFDLREELYNTGELEKFINLIAVVPKSVVNRPEIVQIMNDLRTEWEAYRGRMNTKLSGKKNICIYVGPAYENWNPESIKQKGSGGSEEMCVRMARALAELGNDVTVYNQLGTDMEGTFDGVKYVDFRKFKLEDNWDVLIVERVPGMFMNRLNAKRQYLWLHDTHYGEIPRKLLTLPDKIMVLSEAHRNVLKDFYGEPEDGKFWLTRNAIDVDLVKRIEREGIERDKFNMIYASSYDRGIDRLLKMWPEIKKKIPEATLDIYYGFEVYDKRMDMLLRNNDPEGMALKKNKEMLLELMKQDGVTHHGRVNQEELIRAYFKAGIWAYPTGFFEISCCSGDTPILMPRNHKKYPYGIPIKDLVGKKDFYVYSYDGKTNKIVLGKVKWVAKTRKNAKLLQITLDDGTKLKFTSDHKFLTRDGEYKEVKELKIGESLMPCYERPQFMIKQPTGYWAMEHRMLAETEYGDIKGMVIDHKNGDRFDNSIENLEVLNKQQHAKKTFHKDRYLGKIQRKNMSIAQKKLFQTPERKETARIAGSKRGVKFWDKFRTWTKEEQQKWIDNRKSKVDTKKMAEVLKIKWRNQYSESKYYNHKIVSINKLEQREDVYDMEVEKYHNFAAGGVFVHNCLNAMWAQACGAVPIVSDYAALSETVQHGIKIPMGYTDKQYVEGLWGATHIPDDRRGEMMDWAREKYDFKTLAKEWNEYFEQ